MSFSHSSSQPTGSGSSNSAPAPKLSAKEAFEKAKRERAAAALAAATMGSKTAPGGAEPNVPAVAAPSVPTWPSTDGKGKGKEKAKDFDTPFGLVEVKTPLKKATTKLDLPAVQGKDELSKEEPDGVDQNEVNPLLQSDSRDHKALQGIEMWSERNLENVEKALSAVDALKGPWGIQPDLIHKDYRHRDRPSGFNRTDDGTANFRHSKLHPNYYRSAAVACWQNDGGFEVFGDIYNPGKESTTNIQIFARFACDSMLPYVQLKLDNPFGGDSIYVFICASHISQTDKNPVQAMTASALGKRRELIYQGPGKKKPIMDQETRCGRLVEFKFKLHTEAELESSGADFRTVIITGDIDKDGLDLLSAQFNDKLGETMSESARLLAMIHGGLVDDLSIYVGFVDRNGSLEHQERAQWKNFCTYFRTVMIAALKLGHYWIIHKQQNKNWLNPSFEFDLTTAPRYLVTKWGPMKKPEDGKSFNWDKDAEAVPEQRNWVSFQIPATWPSPDEQLFMLRLAIYREREFQYKYVKKLRDANQGQIDARFRANPVDDRSFVVELKTNIDNSKLRSIIPDVDTRLAISVEGIGKLFGKVIDLPKSDFGADFCALITAPTGKTFRDLQKVTVEFVDDSTTFIRAMHALALVTRNHDERKTGVHVRNLLFGDKIPADHMPIVPSQAEIETYRSHINQALDMHQLEAVEQVFVNPRGTVLIHGPPGTGKTYVDLCAVYALLRMGKKVLVTAAQNEAVTNMVEMWDQLYGEKFGEMWCIWRGAYLKQGLNADPQVRQIGRHENLTAEQEAAIQEADVAFWRHVAIESTNMSEKTIDRWRNRGFATQRLQRIKTISENGKHPLNWRALEYLQLMTRFYQLTQREQNTVLAHEEAFNREFLDKCRLVFSTCSMSWHENLREWYKPDTVFVDEAGAATPVDLMMPIVGFQDTVQRVVLSGDHEQQPPVVTSQACNEGFGILSMSLFQVLADELGQRYRKDQRITVKMLQTQYRMHPDIAEWSNREFYGGKLENAAVTYAPNRLRNTIDEYMLRARPYFGGNRQRYRIAIDISGDGQYASRQFASGTSVCNDTEARFIASFIVDLLTYKPTGPDTRIITPSDLLVVTPYTGQQRLIQQILEEVGVKLPDALFVRTYTTNGVQGNKGKIEFVSLVRNDPYAPGNVGFIYKQHQLNVELTRAQCFQVITGNFWNWMRVIHESEDEKQSLRGGKYKSFRSLLEDLHKKDDIITLEDLVMMFRENRTIDRDDGQFPREFKGFS